MIKYVLKFEIVTVALLIIGKVLFWMLLGLLGIGYIRDMFSDGFWRFVLDITYFEAFIIFFGLVVGYMGFMQHQKRKL